jgi:uncharacterized protein YijF (DUF1287 family)
MHEMKQPDRAFAQWVIGLTLILYTGCKTRVNDPLPENRIAQFAIRMADSVNWPYDAGYQRLSYPNGDVTGGGACTDLVIRVLRKVDIDLQKEVHEDMLAHFGLYPRLWTETLPDANIDHRRVPNLMTWFSRKGYDVGVSNRPEDYQPGDIVCWRLTGGATHIGIHLGNSEVFHNIGPSARREEDFLFKYTIIGHYRLPV